MITSLCTMPVRGTSDDSDRLVTVGPFKFSESDSEAAAGPGTRAGSAGY